MKFSGVRNTVILQDPHEIYKKCFRYNTPSLKPFSTITLIPITMVLPISSQANDKTPARRSPDEVGLYSLSWTWKAKLCLPIY